MNWGDLITWILVIVGWLFVHGATISREKNKEDREASRKIIEEIKIVEKLSIDFQTSQNFSHQNMDMLLWRVSRIIRALQRPPLKFLHIPTDILVSFRQNLTRNTDKSKFHTQLHDGEIILKIHESTDDLIEEIEANSNILF